MASPHTRATFAATLALLGAAFAWVPFLPRLVRALFTRRRDRERILAVLRSGAGTAPVEPPPPTRRAVRVLLVAGEPSGDLHAGDLAAALLRAAPGARLEGLGGPRMRAGGATILHDLVSDPVMGVWPVVRRTPFFFRLYRDLLVRLETDPPDVVVGVDYPGLNLRLARAARRRGIPFVLYVAPQVWAWAPWRIRRIAEDVTRVLPILPFEQRLLEDAGAAASYVGHPLFEHLAARTADGTYRRSLREGGGVLVAVLPGSRRSEVRANLPLLLDAARRAAAERPDLRCVVPLAAERLRGLVDEGLRGAGVSAVIAPPEKSDDAMAAADAALTVSGTATLHLVAHGVPAAIAYRTGAPSRALARLLVVSPWIGLPNLVAGEAILPEFLCGDGAAPQVAQALLRLLPGGEDRERALAGLRRVRERLSAPGAPDRAARWVLAAATPPRPTTGTVAPPGSPGPPSPRAPRAPSPGA